MKKLILLVILAYCSVSCGFMSSLYYWGNEVNNVTDYERFAYKTYDTQTPESICNMICLYEEMVTYPGGKREVPPPGICAEYGYLLLMPETIQHFTEHATNQQKNVFKSVDYATYFPQRGKELLQKEIELYPESAVFIAPLIERLAK